ncbi:MAG TPA: L-threonine 3-dehydrogenase [Chthoniobacteraceae bacterium]|nr:L-threonine 3-dehydrogenase [Chthoniobacteraceae bacterium]
MSNPQMKAIIKEKAAPGLTLVERPIPEPGPGQVRIKVKAMGICGTDLHIWLWDKWAAGRVKPGTIIGHEFMGVVDALGEGVKGVKPGDRVSGEGHIGCGRCYTCRTGNSHICEHVDIIGIDVNGCFAEYLLLPESNVWPLPDDIPDHLGAIHDPFGNAMHTVMSVPVSGKSVLIMGSGMIGAMAVGICRAIGAFSIIAVDPNPAKLDLARRMGAHHALNPQFHDVKKIVGELTHGEGVDTLLEMSGNAGAIGLGLDLTRNGGSVALLGIPAQEVSLDLARDIIFKGLTIHGINGRRMYETWFQMTGFLRNRLLDLSPIITHHLPFEDIETGLELMKAGKSGKVVIYLDKTNPNLKG